MQGRSDVTGTQAAAHDEQASTEADVSVDPDYLSFVRETRRHQRAVGMLPQNVPFIPM
jgi:hypothetical protein